MIEHGIVYLDEEHTVFSDLTEFQVEIEPE